MSEETANNERSSTGDEVKELAALTPEKVPMANIFIFYPHAKRRSTLLNFRARACSSSKTAEERYNFRRGLTVCPLGSDHVAFGLARASAAAVATQMSALVASACIKLPLEDRIPNKTESG